MKSGKFILKIEKNSRSPWDGYSVHPVVANIDLGLSGRGFNIAEQGESYDWDFRWEKSLFCNSSLFFNLYLNKCTKGVVDFSIAIGINSWEFTEAENHLKVWECLKNPQFGLSGESAHAANVVRVPLSFLLLNGTPPVERLTWKSGLTDFAKVAEVVLQDFVAYGEPFLATIDSLPMLIRFLQNMGAKKGVRSVNASLAAAIYLFHAGEKDAALVELKYGFDAAIRKAQSVNRDAEAIQALNCKYERYKNYLLG